MASSSPATPDTPITLKVSFLGSTRRHTLPLSDLSANALLDKVRHDSIHSSLHAIRLSTSITCKHLGKPHAISRLVLQLFTQDFPFQPLIASLSCDLMVDADTFSRSDNCYAFHLTPMPFSSVTLIPLLPTSSSTPATMLSGNSFTVPPRRSASSSSA